MKKTIIILATALAFIATGCKQAPYINVPETVNIPAKGGSHTVTVEANYDWTASSNASWLVIQTTSSAKDPTKLVLNIAANSATDPRTCSVTMKSEDFSKVIQVVQDQVDKIEMISGKTNMDHQAQTVAFEISTNVDYEVVIPSDAKWVTSVKTKGMVPGAFNLILEENKSLKDRTANLQLVNKAKEFSFPFSITQAGAPQVLKFTYKGAKLTAPVLAGVKMSPRTINWGDGKVEQYNPPMTHSYSKEGEYGVVVETSDATTLKIEATRGITFLDITGIDE